IDDRKGLHALACRHIVETPTTMSRERRTKACAGARQRGSEQMSQRGKGGLRRLQSRTRLRSLRENLASLAPPRGQRNPCRRVELARGVGPQSIAGKHV